MTEQEGRSIDLSIEVPGTPEEVWHAIATGPGITSWFVPSEVEEHEGGTVRQDFGEMGADTGRVVAWEPPRRVVFEAGASAGHPLAFEWLVQASSGDTCTVRLVSTGFGHGEEWDADYDGMSMGWRLFLENLRLHLTQFRSERATAAVPMAMVPGPNERAWKELCAAFGVDPVGAGGDEIVLTVGDGGRWGAHVEAVTSAHVLRHYALVLDEPRGAGFLAAEGNGELVSISGYLYFYGESAAEAADTWRAAWADRWSRPG